MSYGGSDTKINNTLERVRIISIAAATWLFSLQQIVNKRFYRVSVCDGRILFAEELLVLR